MTPAPSQVAEIAAKLTANVRLIALGRDLDIATRRARTRARNDARHLRIMWSEGQGLTPLGLAVRQHLTSQGAQQTMGEG